MADRADVVIIGGGVTGTSIAYHLAARGVAVTLCERGEIGSGISGTSGAIIRQHHSIAHLAQMASYSLGVYRNFEDVVGGPCGFVETGYLVIAGAAHLPVLDVSLEDLQAGGIDVHRLDPDDLRDLVPYARWDDVAAASWEPAAGYADGRLTAQTFGSRAQALGAQVRQGMPVTAIQCHGSRVTGVETPAGRINAGTVVVAASTGSPPLTAPLRLDLPLDYQREWICFMRRPWALREPHPAGVDLLIGGHFRPDGGRTTLFGGETRVRDANEIPAAPVGDPEVFERRASNAEIASTRAALGARFPGMESAVSLGGYGCVDDVTPDYLPYLGRVEAVDGLLLAYGMSSHFFKHAPAVGRSIAELVVDGASSLVDLEFFRPERFRDDEPRRSPHPYPDSVTL
jgi:glycine/D-amino acid oxidase-like deaminating enzyme